MKTQEELSALKDEVNGLKTKLAELTEDELEQVTGGLIPIIFAQTQGMGENDYDIEWKKTPGDPTKELVEPGEYTASLT